MSLPLIHIAKQSLQSVKSWFGINYLMGKVSKTGMYLSIGISSCYFCMRAPNKLGRHVQDTEKHSLIAQRPVVPFDDSIRLRDPSDACVNCSSNSLSIDSNSRLVSIWSRLESGTSIVSQSRNAPSRATYIREKLLQNSYFLPCFLCIK